jgi:hypothetical protein
MLTFLIAGHETTSGMLSFAMTHILNNPKVYAQVRQEVDTVLGKEPMKPEHLSKLPYITGLCDPPFTYRKYSLVLLKSCSAGVTPRYTKHRSIHGWF